MMMMMMMIIIIIIIIITHHHHHHHHHHHNHNHHRYPDSIQSNAIISQTGQYVHLLHILTPKCNQPAMRGYEILKPLQVSDNNTTSQGKKKNKNKKI